MAFDQANFATVGAQSTDTPTIYTYKTNDLLALVTSADYFSLKSAQLSEGDLIYLDAFDASAILEVTAVTGTAIEAPFIPKAIANRVVVNEGSDFPAAVGGRIPLAANTEYYIGDNTVSVTDPFTLGQNVVITGAPNASKLTYTGTGNMFEGLDIVTFITRGTTIDCPSAQVFSISDTSPVTTVGLDRFIIESCLKFGTFTDVFALVIELIRATTIADGISTAGILNLINIQRLTLISPSVTFKGIDLGTSVSSTIVIRDYLAVAPPGAFGVSGLANNGNIPVGALAILTTSEFLAGVTPLENITSDDTRWVFGGNTGIPDTNQTSLLTLTGNSTETVIGSAGTGVLVAGTWVVEKVSHFTGTTGGRATYDAERDLTIAQDVVVGLKSASGNFDAFVSIAINGSIIANGVVVAINSTRSVGTSVIFESTLSETDFMEVFVTNVDNTNNIIVESGISRQG